MSNRMDAYMAKLKADTEQLNKLREQEIETEHHRLVSELGNLKPLTEQIEELMRSLPPALRERPWAMADLVGRLQGRYHAKPSAGDVGQALRALGWTRRRDWSVEGGGRRIWYSSWYGN